MYLKKTTACYKLRHMLHMSKITETVLDWPQEQDVFTFKPRRLNKPFFFLSHDPMIVDLS